MPIYVTAPGGTCGGPENQSRSVGVKLRLNQIEGIKGSPNVFEVVGEALKQEFIRCTKDPVNVFHKELTSETIDD
jgi:hypothetical protein